MKKNGMLIILMLATFWGFAVQNAVAQQNDTGRGTDSIAKSSVITGTVIDTDGEPLIGVTVRNLQTKAGSTTNIDGKFSISASVNTLLSFSYIGKKPIQMKVTSGKPMKVVMEDDAEMEEMVVTGIVTKDKNSFTGSASTFTTEELKTIGVQNPIASLAALDPAFNVLTNDLAGSDPNHLPDINIRGKSSVIGERDEAVNDPNQPLFIVDGFESSLEAVYNMDINRIASMTILKDAASTAIYGSKAANGVVVVETVKPEIGKLRLAYNGSMAISAPDLTSYNLMNASEKLEFERLAGRYNSGGSDIINSEVYNNRLADVISGVDTYWLSAPLRTGINHKHNVYVDGGAGGFMFGLGVNYNGITGVMKDSERESYGGNIDLIYRLNKLQFQNKFTASYTATDDPIVSFSEYANANPYYKKTDENGHITPWLQYDDFAKAPNPLYNASLNSRIQGSTLLLSNYLIAEYTPIYQIKLRAKFGLTQTANKGENFISPLDTRFNGREAQQKGSFASNNTNSTRYDGSFTAIYAEVFGKNRINVAGDFNIAESRALTEGYSVLGFPEGDYTYPSFSNGYPTGGKPTYYESVSRSTRLLGTVNYAFDNRYLFDFNYSLSGSSVFGSSKKFINTWAVGAGWNIMNERFFKNLFRNVAMLKLRGSIGNPGNQNFNSAMSIITYGFMYDSFNYFGTSTILERLGNRNLRWQTTIDRNIGIDFRTNRLNVELDYYDKNTDPLLIGISVPLSTGLTSLWNTNMGIQKSRGVLASTTYYIVRKLKERFTWSVRGTLRHENIKLDKLNGVLNDLNEIGKTTSTKRYYDGADPDAIWAVRSAGIDPANGRELFIKKDGSYTYDYDPDNEVIVGNSRAKIEGNLGTNLNYKGLSVNISFSYKVGGKAFNSALYNKVENISGSQLDYNQDRRALTDRWQNPGDHAQFKNIASSASTPMSSRFVQRNNSLNMQSLNINYDFYQVARKLHVEAFRLSFYCNDLFWLTTIKQERGTGYPYARSYTFGLSITL